MYKSQPKRSIEKWIDVNLEKIETNLNVVTC